MQCPEIHQRRSESPEFARLQSGRMRIDYSQEDFFNRVENSDYTVVKLYIESGMNPDVEPHGFAQNFLEI